MENNMYQIKCLVANCKVKSDWKNPVNFVKLQSAIKEIVEFENPDLDRDGCKEIYHEMLDVLLEEGNVEIGRFEIKQIS